MSRFLGNFCHLEELCSIVIYFVFQYGVMEVMNHTTKMKAVLNFKQGGWFGKDLHKIEGFIYNKEYV